MALSGREALQLLIEIVRSLRAVKSDEPLKATWVATMGAAKLSEYLSDLEPHNPSLKRSLWPSVQLRGRLEKARGRFIGI